MSIGPTARTNSARERISEVSHDVPDFGVVVELRPGLLWTRMPLPMSVGHVNIYLIEDTDGWAVIDAGFGDDRTFATWESLLGGALQGMALSRLIVTHAHIDHVGAAGWLCRRLAIPLYMNAEEYLTCRLDLLDPGGSGNPLYRDFLGGLGLDQDAIAATIEHAERFPVGVTPLPPFYHAVSDGEILEIGTRSFRAFLGPGHSTAQLMLSCSAEGWFFSADHILDRVPPLLIQSPLDPDGDYYGLYLQSLHQIEMMVDQDTLVLPGHHVPFQGLRPAIAALKAHHGGRVERVQTESRKVSRSIPELAPLLFPGKMNGRKMHYAVFEILAYINRLSRENRVEWLPADEIGIRKIRAIG